jgi:hypothetical protein
MKTYVAQKKGGKEGYFYYIQKVPNVGVDMVYKEGYLHSRFLELD